MDKNSTFLTGVRLTQGDLEIVQDEMIKTGTLSRSEMLRRIIREWSKLKSKDNGNKENQAQS